MSSKITGINEVQKNKYSTPLKDNINNFLLTKNEIHPAMVMDFINKKTKNQMGGDGYTIDVNRSIGGLVGRSRYSFNYSPIYYGDLLGSEQSTQNGVCGGGKKHISKKKNQSGGDCGCSNETIQKKENIYDMLKNQSGGSVKASQFDAIQQIGKGLVPLSINSLINLVLLIFLYHGVVDKNTDTKKIKKSVQKGGMLGLQQIIAPLGRGNLLVLASLLLLHHFAVERPNTKKQLMKGGNAIYEKLNELLKPLGQKNGLSVVLNDLYESFNIHSKNKEQSGGSILKSIVAPLGTSSFIATGLLLILNKVLIDNQTSSSKNKKGGSKEDFDKLVNLLGPLSFNAFANEQFIKDMFEINKHNKTTPNKKVTVKNKKA